MTYNGHPLHMFVQDTRKGQTYGEALDAFGAEWYAVSPAGAKVEEQGEMNANAGEPRSGDYRGY